MTPLFPYSNIILGAMLLVVGFLFHWVGQLISLINWDLAVKLGIAEPGLAPEFKAYERAIAVADVALAWIYGIAAVGLFLNAEWGYRRPGAASARSVTFIWLSRRQASRPLRCSSFFGKRTGGRIYRARRVRRVSRVSGLPASRVCSYPWTDPRAEAGRITDIFFGHRGLNPSSGFSSAGPDPGSGRSS